MRIGFNPRMLPAGVYFYQRDNPFMDIVDMLPLALEEMLAEYSTIDKILSDREEGKDTGSLEESLIEKIFDDPSTYSSFEITRQLAIIRENYSRNGMDALRNLAFYSKKPFADAAGLDERDVEIKKFMVVNGYVPFNGYHLEKSWGLIPVIDFSQIKRIDAFLNDRISETGKALWPSDMIYSHNTLFDDMGYAIEPDGTKHKQVYIGEAVMFVQKTTWEQKEKDAHSLAELFFRDTVFGELPRVKQEDIESAYRDLCTIMDIGKGHAFMSLSEALFQVMTYTKTIEDTISQDRLYALAQAGSGKETSKLARYLVGSRENFVSFIKIAEHLLKETDYIQPPIGFSMYRAKGQSVGPKLYQSSFTPYLHKHREEYSAFLESKGLHLGNDEPFFRDPRDFLAAEYLGFGPRIYPVNSSYSNGFPLRDPAGEAIVESVFMSHHSNSSQKLTLTDLAILKRGDRSQVPLRESSVHLLLDWMYPRNLEFHEKPNGFVATNSSPRLYIGGSSIFGYAEIRYCSNLSDMLGHVDETQGRGQYKAKIYETQNYLIQKGRLTRNEIYAMDMFWSRDHKVL